MHAGPQLYVQISLVLHTQYLNLFGGAGMETEADCRMILIGKMAKVTLEGVMALSIAIALHPLTQLVKS